MVKCPRLAQLCAGRLIKRDGAGAWMSQIWLRQWEVADIHPMSIKQVTLIAMFRGQAGTKISAWPRPSLAQNAR